MTNIQKTNLEKVFLKAKKELSEKKALFARLATIFKE
jgi:hypothetical protein